ncbi:LPD11 domain-containing protein [Streptococcus sanguinis]|nr:LPD11 domain-containing protein [Streptococcus sanguinis]
MKKLWKKFPEGEKPEWLTWEEILQYERRMTEEDK